MWNFKPDPSPVAFQTAVRNFEVNLHLNQDNGLNTQLIALTTDHSSVQGDKQNIAVGDYAIVTGKGTVFLLNTSKGYSIWKTRG